MRRLAWFAPLLPVRSGVARYNLELLPHLAAAYRIDVMASEEEVVAAPDPRVRLFPAHDFLWRHVREPYDLLVYQLGNAPCHDYMWPYLFRYPGLVVLHDGQLHHARARMLLQHRRYDDYRREFRFNHPDARPDVAELGAEGLLGSLTYFWPMLRAVVEASPLVVVHNEWLARTIRESHPAAHVELVEMGVPEPAPRPDARSAVRARHGIPADAVLFVAFGKVTPEKRILQVVRALAALKDGLPDARLLLAGETVDYYRPLEEARALGIDDRIVAAGFVPDAEVDDYLSASDVCLCLRWPSSRESSASWLRCIAAGKATVTTDLLHTALVPALDPRSWEVAQASAEAAPVTVAIDVIDEDHSLELAMRRLARDARLRHTLGGNAQAYWKERFTLHHMASGYARAIERARALDRTAREVPGLPAHLRQDGTEHVQALLAGAGLSAAMAGGLWSGTPHE